MFIRNTLNTNLTFWRKSRGSASRVKSPADTKPVIESNSPTFDDVTSPPSSSKARKFRFFSTLTRFKKMSLASVFKKGPSVQIHPTVLPCTTSAVPDLSRHILAVSEDGVLQPVMPSPAEHWDGGAEFGLISSAMDRSSNQEDIKPDPPGSRIADRVTSLRMRTAAVWASIPATVEGIPASCASSATSTPVKSKANSLEHDETTTVASATVDSPSFSSPATSVTAVSDWGPRDSLANLSMIGHKQERIRVMPKVFPALDVISLSQPPELGLAHTKPPSKCQKSNGDKLNYTPDTPTSGWESSPEMPSSSSGQRASSRAARHLDSPSPSPRTARTVPSIAGYPITTKRSFHRLPVVQLFTNSDENLATSSIRGSLTTLFQRPLAMDMPLHPWSCAKIARAETKRASRKEQLNKRGFFTRMSRFLEAGPQDSIPVSLKR
ncbi:hypothetical protein DFJ58DRAFT_782339 [Suillus subalutaceus]|uniref:uncharacterized protein n=1 Tax=Suillus subalutaceus TaxID=48586 RepID=UPI001B867898|nr:uncharacterized protein DFJ58DRAFT_782339 [Suillus subalutaceus]KAG1858455.1 hypothetical protein DFJ58DRAFT_782339 [Suillus subalutaceus]